MIDQPTTELPDEHHLALWQFDLAKRIVRMGRNNNDHLVNEMRRSVERFRLGSVSSLPAAENQNGGEKNDEPE